MSEDVRPAAGRERSPNYPAIGLPTAIDMAGKLWAKEKRTAVPPLVAVEAMGYNGLSGASRTVLAALRQYGLVDSTEGSVSLSDLAVDILVHEVTSDERAEAVRKAAKMPELFQELSQTHAEASDSAINAYLITKRRFSPDGARKAVRSFRETTALASRPDGGYSQARATTDTAYGDNMTAPSMAASTQAIGNQKVTPHFIPISDGMRVELKFIGREVTSEDIAAVEDYLAFAKKQVKKSLT